MRLIAHRGNLHGREPLRENSPMYILEALDLNYDVELDLWFHDGKLMLGHDRGEHEVSLDFLLKYVDKLWIHCKNREALEFFSFHHGLMLNYFWHQNDDYVVTSRGYIFTLPGMPLGRSSIAVLPEGLYSKEELASCYGVCSDNIASFA